MQTINENMSNEIIIKNSKFICFLYKISHENDAKNILETIRRENPKATHYCYAYICDEMKKSSDDGEPAGTAGVPILNVLEHEKLNFVLCVVVRYFGGILLGAGGLVRAYSKSVSECLKKTSLNEVINGVLVELSINYNDIKKFEYLLGNRIIVERVFSEDIKYKIKVENDFLDVLQNNNYTYRVLDNIYIEKQ